MPLVSEASAFNLRVELMSLAHICGGNLVYGLGRCFLKARLQGLACMGEPHVLLESETILSLFYDFCDKNSTKEILKMPDGKCLESAGHLWETSYISLHAKGRAVLQNTLLCRKTASSPPRSHFAAVWG